MPVASSPHVVISHAARLKIELQHLAERGLISRWAVPDRVLLVDEIAKTSVGKINKKTLREKYGSDR